MKIPFRIGVGSWIVLLSYFVYEPFAIRASIAPYSYLSQPMSDLGITECGVGTYPWADYFICSPHAPIVNSLFLLTGIVLLIGLWGLKERVKLSRIGKAGFVFLFLFAVGFSFSVIPANVSFEWHTYPALVMFVVAPALFCISVKLNKGKRLTMISAGLLTMIKVAIMAVAFLPIEWGGLLQRLFYFVFYCWGLGMMVRLKGK
ncbi:DUF998 domain-containing protein, partial [Shouchella lehensis]|uniref:DUF998 domain-containing protein n=1 Tax=Shouchella lehensis G1 TaxID=1246626 RepID=A0A060LYH4_9BACI